MSLQYAFAIACAAIYVMVAMGIVQQHRFAKRRGEKR